MLGMNTAIPIPKKSLLNGFQLPISTFNMMPPVFLKLVDGRILISTEIFDLENKIVAKIENNDWKVPNNSMQINYDNIAFEVLDEYDLPRIQIEFVDSKTIFIGGLIYYQDNLLVITDNQVSVIPNIERYYETELTKRRFITEISSLRNEMTKIFKYVGNDWFGERNHQRIVKKPILLIKYMKVENIKPN
jgi:hypothetical protein